MWFFIVCLFACATAFPTHFAQVSPTLTFQPISNAAEGESNYVLLRNAGMYEIENASLIQTSDFSSFETVQLEGSPIGAAYSPKYGYLVATFTNLYSSIDGTKWKSSEIPFSPVAGPFYFENKYVVFSPKPIDFYHNMLFVMISADGVSWESRNTSISFFSNYIQIFFAGNTFYVQTQGIHFSSDLIHWNNSVIIDDFTYISQIFEYPRGQIIAAAWNGVFFYSQLFYRQSEPGIWELIGNLTLHENPDFTVACPGDHLVQFQISGQWFQTENFQEFSPITGPYASLQNCYQFTNITLAVGNNGFIGVATEEQSGFNWNVYNEGIVGEIVDTYFINDQFVLLSIQDIGVIYVSVDGKEWTEANYVPIQRLYYDEQELFYYGVGENSLWTSTSLTGTWSQFPLNFQLGQHNAVAYGNGLFGILASYENTYTVNSSSYIFYTSNPSSGIWYNGYATSLIESSPNFMYFLHRDLVFSNGLFITFDAQTTTIYSSPDLQNWNSALTNCGFWDRVDVTLFAANDWIYLLCFVQVFRSQDATNWERVHLFTESYTFYAMDYLKSTGEYLISAGDGKSLYLSTDGFNFTQISAPLTPTYPTVLTGFAASNEAVIASGAFLPLDFPSDGPSNLLLTAPIN